MSERKLTFVTGIPGTGVRSALAKYGEWCSRNGEPAPEVISLEEEHFIPLARPYLDLLYGIPEADVNVIEALRLPTQLLSRLWSEAFEQAIARAIDALSQGHPVLLTFHGTWYHQANREYISAVDLKLIAESKATPGRMVCLIDDIFDVKARLSKSLGLFEVPVAQDSDFLDAYIKLQRVLDWRNFELVLSNKIAEICGSPHFVLATKHPIKTFHDLITDSERPIIYLAHPISQIRRMGRSSSEAFTTATSSIRELTAGLRARAVVLEPTAIDELRIGNVIGRDGEPLDIPFLTDRWPLPSIELIDLLYVPPDQEVPAFGPTWERLAQKVTATPPPDWQIGEMEQIRLANSLLYALKEHIQMQIKSRDFALLAQARVLAVYRPMLEGNEATGVKIEIEHHVHLGKLDIDRALAIVLHPPEDERAACSELLKLRVKNWYEQGLLNGSSDQLRAFLDTLTPGWVAAVRSSTTDFDAGRRLSAGAKGFGLAFVVPESGAMGEDQATVSRGMDRQRGQEVKNLNSWLESFEAPQVVILREDLSVADFANRVAELL